MKKPVKQTRRNSVVYTNRFKITKALKIGIADEQKIFRQGLISLLSKYKEIEIAFEANSGKEVLTELKENKVDVMILEVDLPIMNGIETAGNISVKYPETKILMISACESASMILSAMNNGCHGYISKRNCITDLVNAILSLNNQFYCFNKLFKKTVLKRMLKGKYNLPLFLEVRLTKREIEVLILTANEYSAKEISDKLFISKRTVEFHRENIIAKIGAKNIIGIVKYAIKYGII